MRGNVIDGHRGRAGGGVVSRRKGALVLVLADDFGMEAEHAPVKAKELQLEMEHLQPAKEQFQLDTEHFRSTAKFATETRLVLRRPLRFARGF